MNKKCLVCGKDLHPFAITDKCTDCARKALEQTFAEYPELRQAWKDTITELRESLKTDASSRRGK